jgi:hypothetical protein
VCLKVKLVHLTTEETKKLEARRMQRTSMCCLQVRCRKSTRDAMRSYVYTSLSVGTCEYAGWCGWGRCVCAVCVQCVGVFGHKFDTTPLPHTPLQPLHVRSLKPNKRARAFLRSMSLARYRTWVQSCYPGGHACHTSCLTPPPVPQPRRSQQRWY